MNSQVQAQIARRSMDRYIHLPIVMLPSPAQLHNLTVELHLACLQNDPDRVTQLMGLGAGRDDLNESGASALEVAEQLNRVEIVKRLMADVDVEKAGMLELLYAIRRGQSTVVQALMEMGVKQQLHDGMVFRGIFLMACAISNAFVVNALVQHGPSINVVAFEEISVYIAQLTGNHVVAEFIHQIGGEQRRRALRANVMSGKQEFKRVLDEFIETPQISSGGEKANEERGEDEYW